MLLTGGFLKKFVPRRCLLAQSQQKKHNCEIFCKLNIKILEPRQWRRSVVLIADFEQILHTAVGF